jgi:glycosyltransferase involved in cell wall biosynthesis
LNRIKKGTVAFVSNTSWSVFNFRLGVIRQLRDEGFEVIVVAPKDEFSAKLIAEGFKYLHIDIDNYGINPLRDVRTVFQLMHIYRKYNPDFIFHYTIKPNIYGSLAAWRCGIPSVAVTTGLGHLFTFKNGLVRFLTLWLYRIAAKLSQEVWFLNDSDRAHFIKKGIVSAKKAFLLESEGVNLKWFKPLEKPEKHIGHRVRFLFAGRLLRDKGVFEFAEAARILSAKYPNAEFELLGFINPENVNSVTPEQIEEWQKQEILTYLGETDDVRQVLSACSCLVFPSFYGEGISRILLEAAAMGKPIITTDNTGCREVVIDGVTGFLTEPRSTSDLIAKLENFIRLSPEDRLTMGRAARKNIEEKFDENRIITHYSHTLKCALIRKPKKVTAS